MTPAGYALVIELRTSVHEHIRAQHAEIRRCRYRPLGNHLARVATYGIMKVRTKRGKELGEYEKGLRRERRRGAERREWKEPGLQGAARDQVSA